MDPYLRELMEVIEKIKIEKPELEEWKAMESKVKEDELIVSDRVWSQLKKDLYSVMISL